MSGHRPDLMPSSVSPKVGWFDRFASVVARFVSRAPFFAACVLMVLTWAPSYFLLRDLNLWQLLINTATTIVTFLLVALLQNTTQRDGQASQRKLNAIAAGLAALMRATAEVEGLADDVEAELESSVRELCAAVGLEEREST